MEILQKLAMSPIIDHKHKGVQNLHQPKKGFLKHQRHPLQKIPSPENIYKKEKKTQYCKRKR
jgi:hypothetical protein